MLNITSAFINNMSPTNYLKKYYPALITLVTLTVFTFFAFYETRDSQNDRKSKLFELRVQRITETIKNRMVDYTQILKGCQALFYASDLVNKTDWEIYSRNLAVSENYPGIQALAYSRYVVKNDIDQFLAKIRKNEINSYELRSSFANDFLAPVVYIYPSNERNNKAVGFDLYADPIRREAIERAIKTGQAALTRKIKLVQEGNKNIQPGLLMFLPVYAPNSNNTKIVGLVSDVFRTHDLMNALLSRFSELDIEIYDGISLNKKQNIYDSNKIFQCGKKLANSQLSMDTSIVIAGTKWRLFINTNANFDASLDYMQPFIVLLAGLTISTLIFLLLINSIKRRNEIVQQLAVSKVLESKKDEFIGIASHELKTPLTSIKAYIQLLERSDLKNKERIYISKASSQIKKLSGLISDLLDVSKIQAGKLQLNITEFLLSELIDDSIESVEHMYATHQIIKPSDIPVITLTGDKFRLEQAMTNFLVNAIKYSPDKKSVQVNTKVTKYEVTIEVIDEGIGISKSNQEKIFDRFFRAEELLPALSGLGIGLYISNQIIKRHNGFIAVKSELNIGSTFYFTLPRQQNDAF